MHSGAWEFTLSDISKLTRFISQIKEISGFSKDLSFPGNFLIGSDVSKGAKKKIIMETSLILNISYGSKAILRKGQSSSTDPKE